MLPSGAELTVNSDGTFDYDPNGAFSSLASGATASDGFTYSVKDSAGETSANFATVTITITGTQNPVAVNDSFTTDNATPFTTGNLLTNDFEPNSGATLSVGTVHDASGNAITLGTATLLPSAALLTVNADGTFDYNPNGGVSLAGEERDGHRHIHLHHHRQSGQDVAERSYGDDDHHGRDTGRGPREL